MNTPEIQMDYPDLVSGDVAIIGMSCIFPGAMNLDAYWQNIVSRVDAIIDVPSERWDTETFYDPDLTIEDRLHCKRGGYLPGSFPFNPLDYGVMPIALEGAEPEQFLLLRLVYDALEDAGYPNGEGINGARTEVIVGKGNYLSAGHANLIQRRIITEQTIRIIQDMHPEYTAEEIDDIKQELFDGLRAFNSETAPSLIPNITTGRITNRLDFMGSNYTVDGACASSLLAVDIGVRNLLTQKSDLIIAGGVHICNDLPFLILFEAINAVSPTSQIRPFDENADGTIPGEGIAVVILKRLAEAVEDGNRIYAVIKGVGTSSDGRAMSVLAPRVEGAELSLRRAYQMAGIDPETVELIEAHGTGTPVGDAAEIEALKHVFGSKESQSPPSCGLGTIKSMIGHTMPAAGMAALIKTALALYYKVLPATLHCEEPNPKFELEKTPLYINTETRPWIHGREDTPRRAGINAFGLGGVNAHVVLEEYQGTSPRSTELPDHRHYQWDTEVLILQGDSRQSLIQQARQLQQYLATAITQENPPHLKDLAYTLNSRLQNGNLEYRLAVIVSSLDELQQRLEYAIGRLSDPNCKQIKDIKGTYFFEEPLGRSGKLAFLFPGEGAQYLNMLADLCLHFPEV
ncbi:MAG: beta-ketoacyl synthase N-terminal-like domain-containing protein, partial [Candidatus Poribacteria bacterium]